MTVPAHRKVHSGHSSGQAGCPSTISFRKPASRLFFNCSFSDSWAVGQMKRKGGWHRIIRGEAMSKARQSLIAVALVLAGTPISAKGPVTNMDADPIRQEYFSAANMYDAERCLLDLDGAVMPIVYRQPDRPDTVMLVYSADQSAHGAMRIDLTNTAQGLHVVARTKFKQVKDCAPPVPSEK